MPATVKDSMSSFDLRRPARSASLEGTLPALSVASFFALRSVQRYSTMSWHNTPYSVGKTRGVVAVTVLDITGRRHLVALVCGDVQRHAVGLVLTVHDFLYVILLHIRSHVLDQALDHIEITGVDRNMEMLPVAKRASEQCTTCKLHALSEAPTEPIWCARDMLEQWHACGQLRQG